MKLFRNILFVFVGGVSAVVLASIQPMQGLRVPMDYYPDGTLKHELLAREAQLTEGGAIDVRGVEFRLFTPEGREEVVIRAEQATVDRVGLRGHSERPVSLARDQLLLTGEGFKWNGTGETIEILRNVRLSFPSQMFRERLGEEGNVEEQD
ncbi:MAG: hypothetical protein ACNA71_02815 [Kiritimatiellia bacterium]